MNTLLARTFVLCTFLFFSLSSEASFWQNLGNTVEAPPGPATCLDGVPGTFIQPGDLYKSELTFSDENQAIYDCFRWFDNGTEPDCPPNLTLVGGSCVCPIGTYNTSEGVCDLPPDGCNDHIPGSVLVGDTCICEVTTEFIIRDGVGGDAACGPKNGTCDAGSTDVAFFNGGEAFCNAQFCDANQKAAAIGTETTPDQIVCITDIGKDIDKDGIPDTEDPDIDGDGIDNDQDTDKDGDGVDNDKDIDPDGKEKGKKASSSGSCGVAPTCSGDVIQCSILRQTWLNACSGEQVKENDFNSELSQQGLTDLEDSNGQPQENWLGTNRTIDASGDATSALSGLFPAGIGGKAVPQTCWPITTINYGLGSFDIDPAPVCTVLGWISTLIYLFAYITAFWILFNAIAKD